MGCFQSRSARRRNPRMFRVYNVDDQGFELNPGKLEVSDTHLIWYQKGKDPIHWPLRCLRRYGFDEELFSFESGRRCPTGPGIYAFKCNHAEGLFNMVQECIQRAGQEDHLRASQNLSSGTARTNSRPASMNETMDLNGFLVPSSNHLNASVNTANQSVHYVNGSVTCMADSAHEYVNTGRTNQPNGGDGLDDHASALLQFLHNPPVTELEPVSVINYVDLDLPRSVENLAEASDDRKNSEKYANIGPELTAALCNDENSVIYMDDMVFTDNPSEVTHQPAYINIGPSRSLESTEIGTEAKQETAPRQLLSEPNYANLSLSNNNNGVCNGNGKGRGKETGKVNYIQLDLNRSNENLSSSQSASQMSQSTFMANPDSPTKKTESYALIDFNKTAALSSTNRGNSEDDRSLRKTRHDSTFGD